MPAWLLTLLLNYIVPIAISILQTLGIPALEKQFPSLVPLIQEILTLLGQGNNPVPSAELKAAADHFTNLVNNAPKKN